MAAKLEAAGIPAYRASRHGSPTLLIGAVTGAARELIEYRALRFLPSVAKQERAPMLAALTYFQRHHAIGRYLRFGVVTAGARIPIGDDLRGAIVSLQRKVSRWASEAQQRYGIAVVFRGTEFTVDVARTFHPHVNVLYAPRAVLAAEAWAAFLSWTHGFFGSHWRDNGVLAKPEEALKYPFKPADTECLDDGELAWLFGQLARLKLAQPLGLFADFAATLKQEGHKVRRVASPAGGPQLIRVRVRQRERAARDQDAPPADEDRENAILAHTAPSASATPYAEPGIIVRNFTAEPVTEGGKLRLAMIEDRHRQAWEAWNANGAPDPAEAVRLASLLLTPPER